MMLLDYEILYLLIFVCLWKTFLCYIFEEGGVGGRLLDPPGRSSLWRENITNVPFNRMDHRQNCGGVKVQWLQNKGKCGICGDPWNGPRDHEFGGKFYSDHISRSYIRNTTINVTVLTSKNLYGWFEFRIAPYSGLDDTVTQEHLDKNILIIKDTGRTKYRVFDAEYHVIPLQLPANLTCDKCILQWKHHTGRLWGCDTDDGSSCCYGCGHIQEQFFGCADVRVIEAEPRTQNDDNISKSPSQVITPYQRWWCLHQCMAEECFVYPCNQIERTKIWEHLFQVKRFTTRTRHIGKTKQKNLRKKRSINSCSFQRNGCIYKATGIYTGWAAIDSWCMLNCVRGHCPLSICTCDCPETTTTSVATTTTTTTTPRPTVAIDDTPDLVKLLSTAGCLYCKLGNESECSDWLCNGYHVTKLNITGNIGDRIRKLSVAFCDFCGSDEDCRRLFCDNENILFHVAKEQRCQYCLSRRDHLCFIELKCDAYFKISDKDTEAEDFNDKEGTESAALRTEDEGSPPVSSSLTEDTSCKASGSYVDNEWVTMWCRINCPRGYCPVSHCTCDELVATTTTTTTTTTPTTTTTTPTTTTTTPTTTTTTPTTTTTTVKTTSVPANRNSQKTYLYAASQLTSLMCDICENKRIMESQNAYQKCINDFCHSKGKGIKEPPNAQDSIDSLLSISLGMQCDMAHHYGSSKPGFCDDTRMVRRFIVSDLCLSCIVLGGGTLCSSRYCMFIQQ